jgi:drug/metabolite transporter (DMT)-like permease
MAALLALLSSVTWGSADYLGGMLAKKRPAIAVVGGSQPFGLLLAVLAALLTGTWTFSQQTVLYGIVSGVAGLTGLVCFYIALSTGRMGIVSPISSLGVILPLIMGLTHGDRPSQIQMIGIGAAVIGIVLASGPELRGGASPRPVIFALCAALTFGLTIYFMARGADDSPTMTIVTMRITQVAIMAVVALAMRSLGGLVVQDLPKLAAIGLTDASANILFTSAAALGLLSITAVLGSLYPMVTVLLAWWLNGERLARLQYWGIAATMFGVLAITVG